MQTIKNETNEKRLITMRNDLTNSEVENKKLINNITLQEKNMGTYADIQGIKRQTRSRSLKI